MDNINFDINSIKSLKSIINTVNNKIDKLNNDIKDLTKKYNDNIIDLEEGDNNE